MGDQLTVNRGIAERYVAALGAMDAEALNALHDGEVVFEILGTTPVSGRFTGREECLAKVFTPVVGALVPGSFSFARESVIAVIDHNGAVLLTRSDGETISGGRYEQVYFLALSIAGDKVVKLDAAYDTAHVRETIFGDQLARPRPRREYRLPADLGPLPPGSGAVEVVRAYYAALAAGDMARWLAVHSPQVVFDLPGTLPVSGHYEGLQACAEGVIQPFLGTFDADQVRFGEQYRILCADDRRVAALMRGGGPTLTGGTADVIFVQVFTVDNGQIVHMHEQLDTAHIEDACYGNPLRDHRAITSGGLNV
jgi:ketosteroid isomerase-like protein